MQNLDKINPLNQEDRELLSDLKSTFDLEIQTVIGQEKVDIVDELFELMTAYNLDFQYKFVGFRNLFD